MSFQLSPFRTARPSPRIALRDDPDIGPLTTRVTATAREVPSVAAQGAFAAHRDALEADTRRGCPSLDDVPEIDGPGCRRSPLTECPEDFGPYFVAFPTDGGPEVDGHVGRLASEGFTHRGNPRLDHPRRRPPPPHVPAGAESTACGTPSAPTVRRVVPARSHGKQLPHPGTGVLGKDRVLVGSPGSRCAPTAPGCLTLPDLIAGSRPVVAILHRHPPPGPKRY